MIDPEKPVGNVDTAAADLRDGVVEAEQQALGTELLEDGFNAVGLTNGRMVEVDVVKAA